jgi:putative membrane protein
MDWAVLTRWSLEPVPVLAALTAIVLYVAGRRGEAASGSAQRWRAQDTYFTLGLAAVLIALVSPIATYDVQTQWDHMLQHVLLLIVAPPLLLLGDCFGTARRGVVALRGAQAPVILGPIDGLARRLHTGRRMAFIVFLAFSVNLLVWHLPALYDATLSNDVLHDLEHTLFFGTGLLFWDQVIRPTTARRVGLGGRAALALSGMLVSWALAVVIGYAAHPLYAYPVTASSGLSGLADQQIAAGIMWVPGGAPFIIALICLGIAWFDDQERLAADVPSQARA